MPTANALRVRKFRARQALAQAQSLASPIHPVIVHPVPPVSAESNPQSPGESVNTVDIELALDYKPWPRRRMFVNQGCPRRLEILEKAYKAMSKNVSNQKTQKAVRPTGLYFKWHYQVYLFLKLQIRQERQVLQGLDLFSGEVAPLVSRKSLARKVTEGGGWGQKVQERIMRHEVLWVTKRRIPEPGQGKHKIISLLEDADTILAVR